MTITRQLLILLLVEVMLLGGIAHLVIGLSPLLSLLFVVLTLLGLRCLVVLLTWGFSRFYPAPAIGLRAWLRMVVWEMLAYLFTFTWLLPFERLLMTPDRLTPSPCPCCWFTVTVAVAGSGGYKEPVWKRPVTWSPPLP